MDDKNKYKYKRQRGTCYTPIPTTSGGIRQVVDTYLKLKGFWIDEYRMTNDLRNGCFVCQLTVYITYDIHNR